MKCSCCCFCWKITGKQFGADNEYGLGLVHISISDVCVRVRDGMAREYCFCESDSLLHLSQIAKKKK